MKSRAKKRFGQHFLRDTRVLDRIIRLIQPGPKDVFLEIGAGRGELSVRLAPLVACLLAVEIDEDCLADLRRVLAPYRGAQAIPADILRLDPAAVANPYMPKGQRLRVTGNLPYNIGTRIVESLLQAGGHIQDLTCLLQLEVAQRITASPFSRSYGYYSVLCQHYSRTELLLVVEPGSFLPRPKVRSGLVRMTPFEPIPKGEFDRTFVALIQAAFAHRRKTLANSLRLHPNWDPIWGECLELAGIDGRRRPESLSVGDYEHLAMVVVDRHSAVG